MSCGVERPYSVRMTDTLAEAEVAAPVRAKAWPWSGRVAFRFSFIYWVLYMLPCAGAVSVIDAFSAMTLDRPYHRAISEHEALHELERCAGTQFDPAMVRSFVALQRDQG